MTNMAEKNLEFKHIDGEPETVDMPFYQDPNFEWSNLRGKRHTFTWVVTGGASSGDYGVFLNVPFDCTIVDVFESHATAGSSDAALNIEKLDDGDALDAGTELLSSDIDLTSTANTVQRGTIARKQRSLLQGQRLALKDKNTLTAVDNVVVTITVKITK